jgi:hypothetical protein
MMSLESIWPVEEQRIGSSQAGKMSSFLSPLRQSAQADDNFLRRIEVQLKITLVWVIEV